MADDALFYLERIAGGVAAPRGRARRGRNPVLTARELDVLRLIVSGATNKEIGASLGLTAKTVMHHSMSIYRKLRVRGRAEATAAAFRLGIVDASDSALMPERGGLAGREAPTAQPEH
jgi:DNA-binding CsgD family transcriptional regulator